MNRNKLKEMMNMVKKVAVKAAKSYSTSMTMLYEYDPQYAQHVDMMMFY